MKVLCLMSLKFPFSTSPMVGTFAGGFLDLLRYQMFHEQLSSLCFVISCLCFSYNV